MKIRFIIVLLIFLAGCSSEWPESKSSSSNSTRSDFDESKRRGDRISSALAAYRAVNSFYPDNLILLVPKYIPKIEPPTAGNRKWVYQTFENRQRYNLGFKGDSSKEPECWFDSKDNHWSCDTK